MGGITPHIQEFGHAGVTSADFNQNKCSLECESDITQLNQSDSKTVKIGKMVKHISQVNMVCLINLVYLENKRI